MTRTQRWARAVMAGARSLNREQWAAAVDRAARRVSERYGSHAFEPATPGEARGRYAVIGPDDVVVDAQLLLDAERALAEAEQATDEFKLLADEEVDAARAARLRRKLEEATMRVRQALAGRGAS